MSRVHEFGDTDASPDRHPGQTEVQNPTTGHAAAEDNSPCCAPLAERVRAAVGNGFLSGFGF